MRTEMREHIGDIIRRLESQLLLKSPLDWNRVIKTWFKENFEEYHIQHKITDRLLEIENTKDSSGFIEWHEESMCAKLGIGLKDSAIFQTGYDYRRDDEGKIDRTMFDGTKENTFSLIAMKKPKND